MRAMERAASIGRACLVVGISSLMTGPQALPASPPAEPIPAQRVLQGDDARRVAALEQQIDTLLGEEDGFQKAQGPAREIVEIRARSRIRPLADDRCPRPASEI